MISKVQSPKDFWTGLIYLAVGAAVILIARDYSFGTACRMGPGYFPLVLSGLLLVFGVVAVVRSFIVPRRAGRRLRPGRPLVLVLGRDGRCSALLLSTPGLVIALLALVLMSAAASEKFRFDWRAALGLVGLVVFCSLVFVKGLGVPMPLFGSWLEPSARLWLAG